MKIKALEKGELVSKSLADIVKCYQTNDKVTIDPTELKRRSSTPLKSGGESAFTIEDFDIQSEIGKGSTGQVFKVGCSKTNKTYAMKKIIMAHIGGKTTQMELLREINLLRESRHPNIITYYTSFLDGNFAYIVTEYAEYGDLDKMLESQRERKRQLSERDIWEVLWQLSLALLHLHAHNMIHRDIKPQNILIAKGRQFKLGDLGESKLIDYNQLLIKMAGTPLYMPPEVILRQRYDQKVDIWALGCVAYRMCNYVHPFESKSLNSLIKNILYSQPKQLSGPYSQNLVNLIMFMLEKNKSKRPYITEVLDKFPSGFNLKPLDLNNYERYLKIGKFLKEKYIDDVNVTKINTVFEKMKTRLTQSKTSVQADYLTSLKEMVKKAKIQGTQHYFPSLAMKSLNESKMKHKSKNIQNVKIVSKLGGRLIKEKKPGSTNLTRNGSIQSLVKKARVESKSPMKKTNYKKDDTINEYFVEQRGCDNKMIYDNKPTNERNHSVERTREVEPIRNTRFVTSLFSPPERIKSFNRKLPPLKIQNTEKKEYGDRSHSFLGGSIASPINNNNCNILVTECEGTKYPIDFSPCSPKYKVEEFSPITNNINSQNIRGNINNNLNNNTFEEAIGEIGNIADIKRMGSNTSLRYFPPSPKRTISENVNNNPGESETISLIQGGNIYGRKKGGTLDTLEGGYRRTGYNERVGSFSNKLEEINTLEGGGGDTQASQKVGSQTLKYSRFSVGKPDMFLNYKLVKSPIHINKEGRKHRKPTIKDLENL